MNQPLLYRQSASTGLLTLLQSLIHPAIVCVCLVATAWAYGVKFDQPYVELLVLAITLSIICFQRPSAATQELLLGNLQLLAGIAGRWFVMLAILLFAGYATKNSAEYSRRVILTWSVVTPVALILGTLALRAYMRRLFMNPTNARTVVFAGCNEASLSLAELLRNKPELCMQVHGFFDDRGADRLDVRGKVNLIGTLPDLPAYVQAHGIEVIFVALPIRHLRRVMDLMDALHDTTASIYYLPDILVFDLIQARTTEIAGIPVISMCETPFHGGSWVTKRITDVALSLIGLIVMSPMLLAIALAIKLTSAGPIVFRQRRYGLDGHQIMVYKFRTMTVTEDGGQIVQATRQDRRVTPIGRFLRRYSLDELPQLVNVLQGRMSLVGPRPHAVAHNEEYRKLIKGYMLRHKVLPGITGLAQINGCRGETSTLEDMRARVTYDLDYLRRWTPLLDLKILLLTIPRLFIDKRAY